MTLLDTPSSTKPNLLVIGAQKAGSTWLHKVLDAHPDVFMSKTKELMFFDNTKQTPQNIETYLENFRDGATHRYRGEATPGYFWISERRGNAAERAHALLGPDIKIVLSLRDPIDRAVSAYFHHFKQGRVDPTKPFESEVQNYGILDVGHYPKHYESWAEFFPADNIMITYFDHIRSNPQAVAAQVYDWLELPHFEYHAPEKRHNAGFAKAIVNGALTIAEADGEGLNARFFAGKLKADPALGLPKITQDDINWLGEFYANDIQYIQSKLGGTDVLWGPKPLQEYA